MTLQDENAAFFDSYVDAFSCWDADVVCEPWKLVGLFPSLGGSFPMDGQTIRGHGATLMDFYRQQGVVRPIGKLLSTTELLSADS